MARPKKSQPEVKEETIQEVAQEVTTEVAQPQVEAPLLEAAPEETVLAGNPKVEESAKLVAAEKTLLSNGFVLPTQYRHIKTGKPVSKWHVRDTGNAAEVFEGSTFIRRYQKQEFGKEYLTLAQQLVDKKNKLLN